MTWERLQQLKGRLARFHQMNENGPVATALELAAALEARMKIDRVMEHESQKPAVNPQIRQHLETALQGYVPAQQEKISAD